MLSEDPRRSTVYKFKRSLEEQPNDEVADIFNILGMVCLFVTMWYRVRQLVSSREQMTLCCKHYLSYVHDCSRLVGSLRFQYKIVAWASVFFNLFGIINSRTGHLDFRQGLVSAMCV